MTSKNPTPVDGIGQALRILRKRRRLTQAGLGGPASITPSMISRYEREEVPIPSTVLGRILKALNFDFYDLAATLRLVRKEPEPPSPLALEIGSLAGALKKEGLELTEEELNRRLLELLVRKLSGDGED
jgi:transcriptional regulator with XRE-family HTH domain